jgi:hypothetical protein
LPVIDLEAKVEGDAAKYEIKMDNQKSMTTSMVEGR